jgi:hypothetical protein
MYDSIRDTGVACQTLCVYMHRKGPNSLVKEDEEGSLTVCPA